jgi:hypothetical protein
MNPTTRTLAQRAASDLAPAESVTAELMPRSESTLGAEVDVQVSTAKRYPRQLVAVIRDAKAMATASPEIAASCAYALPRAGKEITGPSIRLAEIMLSTWGNLRCKTEVTEVSATHLTARGTVWDLEKNVAVSKESRRRITTKTGSRYDEDMIAVTSNAAASIALRNAVFAVVPKAIVDEIYGSAVQAALGPVPERWSKALRVMGVSAARVLARLGVDSADDVTADHLEWLLGIHQAIKAKETTAETEFPPVAKAPPEPVTVPDPEPPSVFTDKSPADLAGSLKETPLGDEGKAEGRRLWKIAEAAGMAIATLKKIREDLGMDVDPRLWTASQCQEFERRIEDHAGGAK